MSDKSFARTLAQHGWEPLLPVVVTRLLGGVVSAETPASAMAGYDRWYRYGSDEPCPDPTGPIGVLDSETGECPHCGAELKPGETCGQLYCMLLLNAARRKGEVFWEPLPEISAIRIVNGIGAYKRPAQR